MNRIREARRRKNLTMKQLGAAIGVTEAAISNYETGKRLPDINVLTAIATYLGETTDYLLDREEAQEKNAPSPDREAEARERLVQLLMEYTPEEVQRIMDFAAGIKAARK